MAAIKLHLKGWEDGEPVERTLDTPDRWAMHAADTIEVQICSPDLDDINVTVLQKPNAIIAKRMGVGACLWEGELLLAAYVASLPRHRFQGMRCVELGSGPGLVGVVLAKLGAQVVITDKDVVLPLIEDNITANGLGSRPTASCSGSAHVAELEWGKEGYEQIVAGLAATPVDLVLAADCCYIDQDGQSPSTPYFVAACRALSGPQTRCLVSFELRSEAVKSTFLTEAAKAFSQVQRLPKSSLPKSYKVDHIELYELRL